MTSKNSVAYHIENNKKNPLNANQSLNNFEIIFLFYLFVYAILCYGVLK